RFVDSLRADDDELLAFDQALRVVGGSAAANADGEGLGHILRDGHEPRDRTEGSPSIVFVQSGDYDAHSLTCQPLASRDDPVIEELRFVDADDFRSMVNLLEELLAVRHRNRRQTHFAVRHDRLVGIPRIHYGLENLNALLGDDSSTEPADQ